MASQPATPARPVLQTVVSDAPTGTWTHPRMPEIQRRLNASTFGDRQIRTIARNVALLAMTVAVPAVLSLHFMSFLKGLLDLMEPWFQYLIYGCRLFALLNIGLASTPLFRATDDLSDIPLTPTQRALLGLTPTTKPATPGSHYITPPRYSRTPTPRSGSRSGSPYSDSPLSGPVGPANGYSPSASPLFQKAITRDANRRLSNGSPSSLNGGRNTEQPASSLFASKPSPGHGRNASVTLSSRWLFEKGKANGLSLRTSYS